MSDVLGITVAELVKLLKQRHIRLPFEIGAFVALETAESLLEASARPRVDDVRLTEDGVVSVYAADAGATEEDAARAVVGVLAHLLVAAGTGVPPVFLELVEQGPRGGVWDLPGLRDELEASLLPLNRSAARRVLTRLLRDVRKAAPDAAPPSSVLTAAAVDDDLDALLGDDEGDLDSPGPEEPDSASAQSAEVVPVEAAPGDAVVDISLGDMGRDSEEAPPDALPATPPSAAAHGQDDPLSMERELPASTAPASTPGRVDAPAAAAPASPLSAPDSGRMPDLDGFEEVGTRSRGGLWALIFVVLTVVLIAGVRVLRPEVFARMIGDAPTEDPSATVEQAAAERRAAQERAQGEADARYGDLMLSVSPERAQVLLYVGRGPTVMPNLPRGVAHEFVAIADGKEPTRAVVPADAAWSSGDDGGLYELAMQTGLTDMRFEDLVLGDSRLGADSMGQPTGELGRVRVLTTPPGAKVYYLIGFGPDVRVRHLPVGEVQELLVYREGYAPERVVVAPSDYRTTADGNIAEATVELRRRRRH